MSTRWYPRYILGNPQLRVFLPDFKMILLKPDPPLPANQVLFKVPVLMTKWDIKNYLEKIYKIPMVQVRTVVKCGELKKSPARQFLVKVEDDYKHAFVTLPAEMKFEFPDLYPQDKIDEQITDVKELRENLEKEKIEEARRNHDRQGVPGWFSV